MSLLTENQIESIVDLILSDYGTRLIVYEVSEAVGLILQDISGFETDDSQCLDQTFDLIRSRYFESASQSAGNA